MRITEALERATRRRESIREWHDEDFRAVRERDLEQPTTPVRSVVVATALCLALSALLTSARIVEIAERQPLGPSRDRWLAGAEVLDRVANFASLNRPYDLLADLRGAGDSAGQRVDTIDEVAADAGLSTTTTTVASSPADSTTTTTTTTTPVVRQRSVTSTDPLRILVFGDSQAELLGQALMSSAGDRSTITSTNHQISSSLARPDYFNWPAALVEELGSTDPEAIVVFLGANDWQDMASADGDRLVRGSNDWRAEWTRRLEILLDLAEESERHVFWVGQPPMRDPTTDEGVAVVNELARPVIEARAGATFIDIWELFGGDGAYRERVPGPDGETVRARIGDGVHLNRTAASWVADEVMRTIAQIWDFQS